MGAHGSELEKGIEIHELNARFLIDLLLWNTLEVLFHYAFGMRVTIRIGITKDATITAYRNKINSPCVDSNAGEGNALFSCLAKGTDDFVIQSIDIPKEVATCSYDVIGKTCQFALFQHTILNGAQNGASTGSAQIYGKKIG